MANIIKTSATAVLALQSVAASTVLKSSDILVPTQLAATLLIHFGRRSATAAGAGVNFRVEATSEISGDGFWVPLAVLTTDFVACESEAATGTNNAGQAVVTVASTTNLTAQDIVFIDNTTITNSEWGRIKTLTVNTSITLEDNLTNAQTAAASTIYDRAEMYAVQLDLTAVKRLRLVVDGSLFTQAFAVRARLITGDSIS
jgi:hypothetical protein